MVEPGYVNPGPGVMAGFAPELGAVGPAAFHAVLEFPMMHVIVASRAGLIFEVERNDLVRSTGSSHFVTFHAADGDVRASQRELGLLMLGDGKQRAVKIRYRMAALAAIQERLLRKLAVVGVLVAVGAFGKLHFVNRVLARGQMTLVAIYFCVLPFERVLGSRMFFDAKQRWLPTLNRVAFCAFALFRPGRELSFVWIWLVAVYAIGEWQRLLEVAIQMALRARNGRVLAEQRVFGFRMVEFEFRQELFPTCGGMAILAPLRFERPFVRIDVAVDASRKLHVFVPRRTAGRVGFVALLAGNLLVLTGQGIAGLRMVELLGGFPIREVVALQAIVSKLSFVGIFVACNAILRQTEEGF